ncbi:MAG: cyclase family protein [Thaumarchaeota archaeon]|nr:cyclase family protein [Nitrososphaerota archaeon]
MKVIDLTQTIRYNMHTFESYPKPLTIPWAKMDIHGYESELIFMSSHTGTHMDAPYHFFPKGKKINEIAVETFVANALLFKLRKRAKEYITKDDIVNFEKARIHKNDAIIFSTGWEEHANKNDYLTGNPGLSKDAAEYLVDKKVSIVGIDSANIDHPSADDFTAHNILLPKGVLIVENLCNLNAINKRRFKLVVLPLKIEGATGSPVRAIALL